MRDINDPSLPISDFPLSRDPIKKKPSKLSSEKRRKTHSGISRTKKVKMESSDPAVVTEPAITAGVNEDMTAAAALLQQQFMQSTSATVPSFHPSSHLLPTTHLLQPLHTHPALHQQQMQVSKIS